MKKLFAAVVIMGALVGSPAHAGYGAWGQCMIEYQAQGTIWPLKLIAPGWFYGLLINEAFHCG